MSIGERIKKLRLEKGLQQGDLARILNISKPAVSFYENGNRDLSTKVIIKLCKFFNVSADYLLGLKESIQ